MGRGSAQFMAQQAQLAQLLALNALFEAARAGEAGRGAAASVQESLPALQCGSQIDPTQDADIERCYRALFDAGEPLRRLS